MIVWVSVVLRRTENNYFFFLGHTLLAFRWFQVFKRNHKAANKRSYKPVNNELTIERNQLKLKICINCKSPFLTTFSLCTKLHTGRTSYFEVLESSPEFKNNYNNN